jgi:hypothetical protein
MKKLVVIAVVFALVAGTAFAEASVSGTVETRLYLVDTEFTDDIVANMHGNIHTASITMTGANEDGTIGGQLRIRAENMTNYTPLRFHKAYVWWKPVDQLRLFLGQDPDGLFETAVLTGWQFHQGNEEYIGFQAWDFWRGIFHGNWDTFGLAFQVYPVEGVNINLVIPTGGPLDTWPRHQNEQVTRDVRLLNMIPFGLRLNANVAIPDIGTIYFSYIGPENYSDEQGSDPDTENRYNHYGDFGLSFLLSAIDGIQAQLGFSTRIARDSDAVKYPFNVGAAAFYKAGDWGVKFRVGAGIGTNGADYKSGGDDTIVHGNVMPWFQVGNATVNVDIGVSANVSDAETLIGWWASPYLTVGPFQAGILFFTVDGHGYNATTARKDADIKFQIPIRMTIGF